MPVIRVKARWEEFAVKRVGEPEGRAAASQMCAAAHIRDVD